MRSGLVVREIGNRRINVAEFIVFCDECGKDPAAAIQALRRT
jgi:hypothetical protein